MNALIARGLFFYAFALGFVYGKLWTERKHKKGDNMIALLAFTLGFFCGVALTLLVAYFNSI